MEGLFDLFNPTGEPIRVRGGQHFKQMQMDPFAQLMYGPLKASFEALQPPGSDIYGDKLRDELARKKESKDRADEAKRQEVADSQGMREYNAMRSRMISEGQSEQKIQAAYQMQRKAHPEWYVDGY